MADLNNIEEVNEKKVWPSLLCPLPLKFLLVELTDFCLFFISQFLVACTAKLGLTTHAKLLFDWEGKEIKDLKDGKMETCWHCDFSLLYV